MATPFSGLAMTIGASHATKPARPEDLWQTAPHCDLEDSRVEHENDINGEIVVKINVF